MILLFFHFVPLQTLDNVALQPHFVQLKKNHTQPWPTPEQQQQQNEEQNQRIHQSIRSQKEEVHKLEEEVEVHKVLEETATKMPELTRSVPIPVRSVQDREKRRLCGAHTPNACMPHPAVLIMSHKKLSLLERALKQICALSLISFFTVYVSEDTGNGEFVRVSRESGCVNETFFYSQPYFTGTPRGSFPNSGLANISRHFGSALEEVFDVRGHSHVVVIEDDLVVSDDILELFRSSAWILEQDESVWCVSAWNDQGFGHTSSGDPSLLRRTDYFPGLGWMISASTWRDIGPRWPKRATTGWDHWMRIPTTSHGRECIVPEVPRTRHVPIGKGTNVVNNAQFERFAFDSVGVSKRDDGFGDLQYLLKPAYDAYLASLVRQANVTTLVIPAPASRRPKVGYASHLIDALPPGSITLVLYLREGYKQIALPLGLWPEAPRGTRGGLIALRTPKGAHLLLADQRRCTLLPDELRVFPKRNYLDLVAHIGETCSDACARKGLRCDEPELEWVNNCDALQKHFACEGGCGHQVGSELPAYASDVSLDTYQQCLFSDIAVSKCDSRYTKTIRLCRCL